MRKSAGLLVLVLCLALAGCGGQTSDTTTTADGVTTTAGEPGTTSAAVPEGLITSIDDLSQATIQIVATGSFVTPDFGEFEGAGSGSGFIIDPSGVAVTNSHVVSGAGLIEVFVGGEPDPINAQILGVSECNDLAVIDLAGDGYRYLNWYEGDVNPRLDVMAAGYPLGDPQFTLTQGIISKSDFPGETEWASVDAILEHDARIRPGNSGGPLVTENAEVVGVNYAGRDDTDQNFAISVTEARSLVERLRGGEDVDSVGINGYALFADDGTPGVWVETVQPGSPADRTGVTGGDLVTRMAGVSLGLDGTMADFCDVIRTQGTSGVIPVEVLRFDTSQVLRGQFNGDALVETFSFAEELDESGRVEETTATYDEYVVINDDTDAIQVEIPAEWADIDGAPYEDEAGNSIIDVRASSDLTAFFESWDVPGMIFSASSDWATTTSEEALLDEFVSSSEGQCVYAGREIYEDPAYTGWYDTFTDCGSAFATYVVVAARPPEGNFIIRVQVQANEDRDFDALDRILSSFYVIGDV